MELGRGVVDLLVLKMSKVGHEQLNLMCVAGGGVGHILPMGTIPSADETRVSVGCNRDAPRWGGWINYSFVTQI